MTGPRQARGTRGSGKTKARAKRVAIASSSPIGLLALHLLARWRKAGAGGLVFLADNENRAERLGAVIHALDPTCQILVFPRLNTLPFDQMDPSPDIAGRRSSVLRRLAKPATSNFLITTPEAIMERLPNPATWSRLSLRLRTDDTYSEQDIQARLTQLGYDLEEPADYPGGVLFHGRMFEIFPAGALGPFRLEYSQGRIGRITAFNPVDQEGAHELSELLIDPMSERLELVERARKKSSLFEYCSRAEWVTDANVPSRADTWLGTIEEAGAGSGRARDYLTRAEWKDGIKKIKLLAKTAPYRATPEFSTHSSPRKSLRAFVADVRRRGARLLFVAGRGEDLRAMEKLSGIRPERFPNWAGAVSGSKPEAALLADFDGGFVIPARKPLVVITATDVLGSRAFHPQPMARAWASPFDSADVPGIDTIVVHLHRGLGRLEGLQSLAAAGMPAREFVKLVFADDDAVLVPPAELALIWPYASEQGELSLDEADGRSWHARRAEAESELHVTARQLAKQISERRRRRAPKLVPPGALYEKFVARFPYFPTPDQAQAIRDVLDDLAAGHPMDRVVCGDVGFGKTEVALRATAAAVLSGKQVAVAVPTTVLARQHTDTFRKRFAPFGIDVANLSRAASAAEMRKIRQDLSDGSLKIVIGTQALASSEVAFADLGLVIIDEEQHFGAAEKAKLSSLSKNVHTLWMSATPIPRTLAAGLASLRDLSVIATPPVQRAPVVTRIAPLSDAAIAAPLLREKRRRGQSFVICPRIKDIEPMRARLSALAPELRIVCVHGKLPADDIDERMMSFVQGEADVLLATNIVESGLDIPRANTIVVCSPERFGLAQLHQLRGRVGRAGARAFAHFLTDKGSTQSEKRLAVLEELDRPGAGFAISARDLDLRGAGDLLSDRQSGHVQVFGPALYTHLLKLALRRDGDAMSSLWVPELNLPFPELLPASYVQSDGLRLEFYTRVARCASEEELEDIEDEARRRFGKLPEAAQEFFATAKLRIRCRDMGIHKLDAGPEAMAANFLPGRIRKSRVRRMQRDGDRVISANDEGIVTPKAVEKFLDSLS